MKKLIFFVMFFLNSIVFAQYIQNVGMIDGATGNLVYTDVNRPPPGADPYSWSGFVSTSSNGGGYSGGYMPGWNGSTGTFIFGYNQGTIHYSTPVNYALSMAGTNIQVNGFKYSWEYLNQDFSRGTLSANINLTNASGQVLQNYNYNMPRTTNGWTKYSGIENFNTQYQASTLGNLNVSFTGKDDRWWAGYYGPQVRSIDVSLLYSVAPPPVQTDFSKWVKLTDENGDFTLTTDGVVRYGAQGTYVYANFKAGTYSCTNGAWGTDPIGGVYKECDFGTNTTTPTNTTTIPKSTTTDYSTTVALLDPVTTTTTTDPVVATSPTSTTTNTTSPVDTTNSTTPTTSSSPQVGTISVVSAPAPTTSTSTTASSSSGSTSSSSSSASATQSSTKDGSGSTGGGNVSLALSVIGKNSERDAAGSAVAQSAVAQAQAAATQSQQEAASVASNAVSNSMTVNAASVGSQQSSGNGIRVNGNNNSTNFTLQSGQTTLASVGAPQAIQTTYVQQQGSSTGVNVFTGQQVVVTNTTQQQATNNTSTNVIALLQPQSYIMLAPVMSTGSEQQIQQPATSQNGGMNAQTVETYSMLTPNMLTDKTNPLTDIVEGKQNIPQSNTTVTTGPVVNKNAQDNDVAGGVNINKMALAPTGYGDYLNFTMKDVAFYAPKEVYKNQRNVDNARALRQLMTDTKHKQMVEEQYRR